MSKSVRLSAVPALGVLLGACGGSSDGGPLPVDYAVISVSNAPAIAGDVLGASLKGGPIGEYARLLALGGSLSTPPPSGSSSKHGELPHAKALAGTSQGSPPAAPIAPTTSPCSVAGSVTLSGDISSTETLTAGDTIAFEFADCDDGIIVVSGLFQISIRRFAGDFVGGSFSFEIDATLGEFHVTQNGVTSASIDGTVTLGLELTASSSIVLSVDSSSLDIDDGFTVLTLSNYSLSETRDGGTGAYTRSVSGRLTSSAFFGAVDFDTSVALESLDDGHAYTGRIEISGAGGATIDIIVLDSTAVRLEVDEDGNGTVDMSVDTTWDALL